MSGLALLCSCSLLCHFASECAGLCFLPALSAWAFAYDAGPWQCDCTCWLITALIPSTVLQQHVVAQHRARIKQHICVCTHCTSHTKSSSVTNMQTRCDLCRPCCPPSLQDTECERDSVCTSNSAGNSVCEFTADLAPRLGPIPAPGPADGMMPELGPTGNDFGGFSPMMPMSAPGERGPGAPGVGSGGGGYGSGEGNAVGDAGGGGGDGAGSGGDRGHDGSGRLGGGLSCPQLVQMYREQGCANDLPH